MEMTSRFFLGRVRVMVISPGESGKKTKAYLEEKKKSRRYADPLSLH